MTKRPTPRRPLTAPKRTTPPAPAKKPKRAARKTPRSKAKRGLLSRLLRWIGHKIWWITSRVALIGFLILGGATGYYYSTLPPATELMDNRSKGSVTMLDRSGQVFAWRGEQFGGIIRSGTVSKHLRNAVVATEDKRFYRHFGISPRGILGAIRTNLREGRSALSGHGGSTITQQVAKLVFFSDLPSKVRKIKEVPMAMAMELKYTKDEILTIYMNRAFLGSGSFGFEAASQRYFGKSATQLRPAEAAMLAGLLKAPSRYAPTRNLGRAQNRANLIVGLMRDQDYLTAQQANEARTNPAQLSQAAEARAGGYFADWIMEAAPEFLVKDTTEDLLIKTTFDPRIQKAAEEALAFVFDTKVRKGSKAQAAIIVMSADGAVRGMVGGRKTNNVGGFNRATQALRQTGSSFKPFVYAAALESGYTPNTIVQDAPLTLNVRGSGPWSPKNYTRKFQGPVTLTYSLANSINTTAVRVSEDIGRAKVRALAKDFGINSEIPDVPAIALGASEATLLEMTGAYAGILNLGRRAEPYGLTELTLQGDQTPLMGAPNTQGLRVINDRAAGELIYMMSKVITDGSGRRASLGNREAAGKTGTTTGARDAWFIGFTADYVAGVWMGYDDNSKLKGVTGSGLPSDIWRETMVRVHEGLPNEPLPMIIPRAPAQPEAQPQTSNRSLGDQIKDDLKKLEDNVKADLKNLEDEATSVLENVLKGLFGN